MRGESTQGVGLERGLVVILCSLLVQHLLHSEGCCYLCEHVVPVSCLQAKEGERTSLEQTNTSMKTQLDTAMSELQVWGAPA